MMKLFDIANQYCKESSWKTIAALKFCLLSLGMAIGMCIPDGMKQTILAVCVAVFIVTCIPLMKKLFDIAGRK